jgi:hypothetical protein
MWDVWLAISNSEQWQRTLSTHPGKLDLFKDLGESQITGENYFLASGPKIRVVTSDGSVQDRHR